MVPVSYTHLDVYKRQIKQKPSTACVMKNRICKYVSAKSKHCLCCILKGVKHLSLIHIYTAANGDSKASHLIEKSDRYFSQCKEKIAELKSCLLYTSTDEEQDIQREIRDTNVDTASIVERIAQMIYGDIFTTKKFRYEMCIRDRLYMSYSYCLYTTKSSYSMPLLI